MSTARVPLATRRAALAAALGLLAGCTASEPTRGGAPEPVVHVSVGLELGELCVDVGSAGEGGAGSGCDSGHCVDGVCCDTACDSPCEACTAARKEALAGDGVCGPARAGTDPHGDCAATTVTSCGKTGDCDGSGACRLYPSGTACGTTSCTGNSVDGPVCNGAGVCQDPASLVPCAPYVCSGDACRTPCASDDDCFATSDICDNGICRPKRARGQACDGAAECASGFCSEGVCCNTACTGQCAACNLPAMLGSCAAVTGMPRAPRAACSGEGPCQGACDGSSLTSCAFPSSATVCAAAGCTDGSALGAGHCDGTGECAPGELEDCGRYACEDGACRVSCAVASDCAAGSLCDPSDECVLAPEATCRDAFTVEEPGGALTSCEPYRCAAGACRSRCTGVTDCADGFDCSGSRCVEPSAGEGGAAGTQTLPRSGAGGAAGRGTGGRAGGAGRSAAAPPTDAESGCGCRVPRGGARHGEKFGIVVLVGLALLRRKGCSRKRNRRR